MRDRGPGPAARDRARPSEERSLIPVEPRFVGSFPSADVPLDPPLPEIALLGRSNVGKSSLLNVLAAVTKGDKLPRGPRAGRERELRGMLELDTDQLIMTSARTREGIAELQEAVAALARGAMA